MLVTEDRAKEMWCSASRIGQAGKIGAPAYNRTIDDAGAPIEKMRLPASAHCIASQCMWWRWAEQLDQPKTLGGSAIAPQMRWGYCGIAGKP